MLRKMFFIALIFRGSQENFLAIFDITFYFIALSQGGVMAHFLYISDVFCPWCYGFSGNILKIKQEFGLPFEVYGGALADPAVSLAERMKQRPNVQGFIDRMFEITGVRLSDKYVQMLTSEEAKNIYMDSRKASHLFYVLKQIKPDLGLEIMEFLQDRFYRLGEDVFSPAVVRDFAAAYGADADTVFSMLGQADLQEQSYEETEKGFEILGEVVLYPTLYYVDDSGSRHFISRGYVEYEACRKTILNTAEAVKNAALPQFEVLLGKSCTLDGKCE